ncbi:hypothetical protein OIV83_000053 [Microbotryomycetes sp. JL201]|nr:hypothetical protein OIV83_000053 [Microbotryomycetes sp. JL201]
MAPAQVLPAAPSRSRSDPKPVLTTSKQWIVPERPKPGRKPGSGSGAKSMNAVRRPVASQKHISSNDAADPTQIVADLRQRLREVERSDNQTRLQLDRALADNAHLRQLVQELKTELSYVRSYSSAAADALRSVATQETAEQNMLTRNDRPTKRRRTSSTSSSSQSSERYTHSMSVAPLSSSTSIDHSPPLETTSMPSTCGLCQTDSECFCAQVSLQVSPDSVANGGRDELITGQPPFAAIPLRLRQSKSSVKRNTVWSVVDPASQSASQQPVLCSGDPSNCPACSDDPFGKAFCESLSQSVCSTHPCKNCPGNCGKSVKSPAPTQQRTAADVEAETEARLFETLTDLPCCGDPAMCGSRTCEPSKQAKDAVESTALNAAATVEELPRSVPRGVRTTSTDKIPCNEAWMTLKQHPNIAFADLQMLADVVAKRTHCEGPASVEQSNDLAASISDPAESSFGHSGSAQSGQRRLTVEKSAVREALMILDRAVAGRNGSTL